MKFELDKEVTKSYEHQKPPFGYNGLGELVYKRTYSRLLDDGTKEKWHQTVERVVNGCYSVQKEHIQRHSLGWNEPKGQKSAAEMYDLMFNLKMLPPGRGLWMMGTDFIDKNGSAALNNPLKEDTLILTKEFGWVEIGKLENTKVHVLSSAKDFNNPNDKTSAKTWSEAFIPTAENHQCMEITYESVFGEQYKVVCSENHRWFRKRNTKTPFERVVTTDLKVGDKLPRVMPSKLATISEIGAAHGYFFGDGTRSTGELFQFTDDNKEILRKLLPEACVVPSAKVTTCGLTGLRGKNLPLAWGKLPEGEYLLDNSYVLSFLAGYYAADGSSDYRISSSRLEELTAIKYLFLRIGVESKDIKLVSTTSNYKKDRKLYSLKLNSDDLFKEFFLQSNRLESWLKRKKPSNTRLTITNIKNVGNNRVLCAEVPKYGNFVTEGFCLTSNCAFVSTKNIDLESSLPFEFCMDMLMNGVGVGFDLKGAEQIGVSFPEDQHTETFIIPDSREGWVASVARLLRVYFNNDSIIEFDYSHIRKEGETIHGFGGIASGYKPLELLHNNIVEVLTKNIGEPISSMSILDIFNHIACCVVAGNIRRSALIAIGDSSDNYYINAKNYDVNPERESFGWSSNNSVYVKENQDFKALATRTANNGEPGYIFIDNAKNFGRTDDVDRKEPLLEGVNPCVTGDTLIATSEGVTRADQLLDKHFTAYVEGGKYNATNFWKSGVKNVVKITLRNGQYVKLTPDHKVFNKKGIAIKAGNLTIGDEIKLSLGINNNLIVMQDYSDGYLCGQLIGDGTFSSIGNPIISIWNNDPLSYQPYIFIKEALLDGRFAKVKRKTANITEYRISSNKLTLLAKKYNILPNSKCVPTTGSSSFNKGLISAFFDADGTVLRSKKGNSIRLSQSNIDRLTTVQILLCQLGIKSTIYKNRRKEMYRKLPDGKGGKKAYLGKAYHELVISRNSIWLFEEYVGLKDNNKKDKITDIVNNTKAYKDSTVVAVSSIEYIGDEAVYDCTVDTVHKFSANGILVANCGEQFLESYELCNLVEIFLNNITDKNEFDKCIKYAYLYAKSVTLIPTHWALTNRVMLRNRRIGMSLSGVRQFIAKNSMLDLKKYTDHGYALGRYYDDIYSDWLCVPHSVKITTVKPSGTISLLAGATPGIHFPISRFYIRRVRLAKDSKLLAPLREANYFIEKAKFQEDSTVVVEFPIDVGEGIRAESDASIWEQAELVVFMQKYWSDNAVSNTITFNKSTEGAYIENVLDMLQFKVKSLSFLPRDNTTYPQMPYESITENRYRELIRNIKPVIYEKFTEEAIGERYCDSESCTI